MNDPTQSNPNPCHWPLRRLSVFSVSLLVGALMGCSVPTSEIETFNVNPLGSAVDEIQKQMEENAEANKFVVYMHEFEINEPRDFELGNTGFAGQPDTTRGYRLNAAGQDHLRQIAKQLQISLSSDDIVPAVVIEQSDTSKKHGSVYQYPVHRNSQLDEIRRHVVVSALERLGIDGAENYVVIAPVAANGLSAREAAAAYERSISRGASSTGNGFGGSRF